MPLMRLLGICSGATVIALGIYSIFQEQELKNVVSNIYRIIFGVLIMAAEFRLSSLLTWFSFLTFFSGLGAFYVFVGGLALGSEWYEIAIAIVLCSMGFLYMASACACSEYAQQHQKQTTRAGQDHHATTEESGAAESGGTDGTSPYNEMENGEARREKLIDNPFGESDAPVSQPHGAYSGSTNQYNGASRGAYGVQSDSDNPFAGSQARTGAY